MKKFILGLTLLLTQLTYAKAPHLVISEIERAENVKCELVKRSMNICLNFLCRVKEDYTCYGALDAQNIRLIISRKKLVSGEWVENVKKVKRVSSF